MFCLHVKEIISICLLVWGLFCEVYEKRVKKQSMIDRMLCRISGNQELNGYCLTESESLLSCPGIINQGINCL